MISIGQQRKAILTWAIVIAVLLTAVAPALPLIISTLGQESTRILWTDAFGKSIRTTLWLGLGVSVFSLLIGLPLGLLSALYRFPFRRALILFQVLPLLLPSFLLCIGWSNLAVAKWLSWLPNIQGFRGCVFVMGLQAISLTFFATLAACQNLTASQIDAARLHGGEQSVLKQSFAACAPVATLAALLAGILSFSDPGAPLILGCRSVSVEILTSFSALFDYQLAGRQCLVLAGLVLLLSVPVLLLGLRRFASATLARQSRPAMPYRHGFLGWLTLTCLLICLVVGVVMPVLGLCLPAAQNPMFERAANKVADTALPSFVFYGGAAIFAVVVATVVSLAVSQNHGARLTTIGCLLAVLAMPPALAGIGITQIATRTPLELDWLMRSQLTVVLILGLRFLPVATVMMMRAIGSLSPSWNDAARVHGVPTSRFFACVIVPNVAAAVFVSALLVTVLAAADITTAHLLQPPGVQTLPVAIFTVMANSPEGLVASLCLLYLLCVMMLLTAVSQVTRSKSGSST